MAKIFNRPFATTGDREDLPVSDQPDGKASWDAGWTPDYELPSDNPNSRPVGRQEMNGVLHGVTEALGELQLFGFAKWQAVVGGWPLGAMAYHGGAVYKSTDGANTTQPGSPGAKWELAFWHSAALTGNPTAPTQAPGNVSTRIATTEFVAQELTRAIKDIPGVVRRVYTSNATWKKPAGLKSALVQVQGGGGGGGGTISTTATNRAVIGAGGGAGGYVEALISADALPAEVLVTHGASGGGGAVSGSGAAGGASSFGAILTASGGGGGGAGQVQQAAVTRGLAAGGVAGATSASAIGALSYGGESGGIGFSFAAAGAGISGNGGSSHLGVGGPSVAEGSPGLNASGYGAGGSGGCSGSPSGSDGGRPGGSGSPGVVIVTEYY
ncbi:tail fiber [Bordetella phage vB_BaM-IFTN2]|nr:tail fiber [Bordetella phage vB_BaM-IFTN2]UOK17217.1 tail fiber [Bordetella phage vB_BaM-IFTN4]UOK17289.1 tail fiber [Bordetella phage vB_BaM-IFTN5]UOK17358.1 tail fiber [Bordetella phage vB_BaM-IFTN6]